MSRRENYRNLAAATYLMASGETDETRKALLEILANRYAALAALEEPAQGTATAAAAHVGGMHIDLRSTRS